MPTARPNRATPRPADPSVRCAASTPGLPQDPVFASERGTNYWPNNLESRLRAARDEKFDWVTFHTFRKTTATKIKHRLGEQAAADALGHAGTGVTRKHYIDDGGVLPLVDVRSIFDGPSS